MIVFSLNMFIGIERNDWVWAVAGFGSWPVASKYMYIIDHTRNTKQYLTSRANLSRQIIKKHQKSIFPINLQIFEKKNNDSSAGQDIKHFNFSLLFLHFA